MNYAKVDIYFILPHFLIFTKEEPSSVALKQQLLLYA